MTGGDGVDLLLVEDDPDDARFVERLLTEYGRVDERLVELGSVTRAERLAEAVSLLEDDPDVVLLDLRLPDSEGVETVETLAERAPHVPLVVITGRTEPGLGPEAIREGAQDYLTKGSITADVLHRTIRYAIDRNEKQREIVELNRRLSLLNRIVRGDVRNDLAMVVGRGDELRARLEGDDRALVDSLLEAARRAVERTDTASQLLSVLSADGDPELEPLDLGGIVDEQAGRLRDRSDADVTVRRDADDAVFVEASPLLDSALEQFLSNAVEHNDRERPAVTVTIEPSADSVALVVEDDGVGIPDVQRRLLDDPDARYHDRAGVGTGLYHALTVVELSGGDVGFADNDPRGTVVTVTLPRARPE